MVIVTGGSGHIGNVLVRALLSQNYKVAVIDKDPKDKALDGLPIEYYQGDIRDLDFLTNIFKKAEYVCHLAGIISIAPGKEELMYAVNVEGTKTVIEACKKAKVKRLLYTSSIHALYEPPKDKTAINPAGLSKLPVTAKELWLDGYLPMYCKTP